MRSDAQPLRAPFPWFGGKSRAAPLVWAAFGDVANYVEPFAGSLAVLLARPTAPRIETVNDRDCYLANAWRSIARDPAAVAAHADWPVNEADLHARHRWLRAQTEFRERMLCDPDFYDAKLAGWWLWGVSAWIGDGWCAEPATAHVPSRQLPHVGNAGRGTALKDYFEQLFARLRSVRVACGDWTRVTGDSVTWHHGVTGVLLDPPYEEGNMAYGIAGEGSIDAVRAWALDAGQRPDMRVALCGYEGQHAMPAAWRCVAWKARGGYGSTRRDATNANAARERIWLSPACLALEPARQLALGAWCDP